MTKEEKDLLLRDLCARLPYHVRCKIWLKDGTTEEGPLDLEHNYADVLLDAFYYNKIKDIKPYLRPMSSMTKEEKEKLKSLYDAENVTNESICFLEGGTLEEYEAEISFIFCYNIVSWLLENHFGFMGLIEKGLAIAVTEENNPY